MSETDKEVFVVVDLTDEDEISVFPYHFPSKDAAKDFVQGQFDDHTFPEGIEWEGDDLLNDYDGRVIYQVSGVSPYKG
jgi:hypothetical protein